VNGGTVNISNVLAKSEGTVIGNTSIGSKLVIKNATLLGDIGVSNGGGADTEIHHSVIEGATQSIAAYSIGTVKIAYSQLIGSILGSTSTLSCLGTYDANFTPLSCPH
jgi:hypothetical protein